MQQELKAYFEKVFADILAKIPTPGIREKTVAAWVTAAEDGGWNAGDIESIPFTLLTETKGINLIEHTRAVTLGAAGLAEAMKKSYETMPFEIDDDYLYAGGLLHDVGKLMEIQHVNGAYGKSRNGMCMRHPISGAIVAAKLGLPDEIVNIIATHAKEGDGRPKRIEGVLIHQADFATFDPMVMLNNKQLIV